MFADGRHVDQVSAGRTLPVRFSSRGCPGRPRASLLSSRKVLAFFHVFGCTLQHQPPFDWTKKKKKKRAKGILPTSALFCAICNSRKKIKNLVSSGMMNIKTFLFTTSKWCQLNTLNYSHIYLLPRLPGGIFHQGPLFALN